MVDAWHVLAEADRTGGYVLALEAADRHLASGGEDLGRSRLDWLYVRVASLHLLRRHREAVTTSNEMVREAPTPAWLSLALGSRAVMNYFATLDDPVPSSPGQRVLDDLSRAAALNTDAPTEGEVRAVAAAHNFLATGYWLLGLFELADPHFHDAHRMSTESAQWAAAARALLNLTMMQIEQGDEFHRIGQPEAAVRLWGEAADHGRQAEELTDGADLGVLRRRATLFRAAASARFGPTAPTIATLTELAQFDWVPSAHLAVLQVALSCAHLRAGDGEAALTQARAAVRLMSGVFGGPASIQAHQALAAALPRNTHVVEALAYAAVVAGTRWRDRQQLLDAARVSLDYERVAEEQRRADALSKTDLLTGVGNRRALHLQVQEWLDVENGPQTAALLLADVDGLKAVNDRSGHTAGDRLLVAAARHLRSACGEEGSVVRWGGDEFVVLLPEMPVTEAAQCRRP